MAFPSTAGADPDPTTQIPWPKGGGSRLPPTQTRENDASEPSRSTVPDNKTLDPNEIGKRQLTSWNLFCLSVSMAGSQVAWTVELGYGTPFLLDLGLPEQLTSLVWLAGPISGLIAQPLIGAISDSSKSRYRRRYWIVASTIVLVISTLALAYCELAASFFVDLLGGGLGDWDPKRNVAVTNTAIGIAVAAFYLLDFSLNALQASLRNLLLDIAPPAQLNLGNAWHGRMLHAGNIAGYGFGFLPLAELPILRLVGGTQFRKFCILAMVILVVTVWVTCWTQEEKEGKKDIGKSRTTFLDILKNIWVAIVKLPKPIRRVCLVQIFAYMGWFPFLFYATTYVGQVLAKQMNAEPDLEVATRAGYLALLIFSIVAVVAGTFLPRLTHRDTRLLAHDGDDEEEDAELTRLRDMVQQWRAEAVREGKPLKLPRMPFMLRNIWTAALVLYTLITFSTFYITTVAGAMVAIALTGICWAVACWVPFAIIMEFLKEMDVKNRDRDANADYGSGRIHYHTRAISSPAMVKWKPTNSRERQPLMPRRRSLMAPNEGPVETQPAAGGTVLGIHNLAIVMPQFFVALASSVIFRIVDGAEDPSDHNTFYGRNGVAWVLRFGGLCGLAGAFVARMVPPTKTEKEMRRRLGEMEVLRQADSSP
ncbi:MFS general substrate transporter [Rickenella mellea]|uniref:MFS general substrate transporter n=1 Tax=Rickenella mellea TaxID=50990 RepID=A0A4R5XEB4_9AGAM|nr:MFS general substrate transporter [Rickenella mellea]